MSTCQMRCPVCWRDVDLDVNTDGDQIVVLHLDRLARRCEMSYKTAPARLLRELKLEESAARVMQLAAEMRDDIEHVWTAVDTASRDDLREWLLIALAAVNIDRKPSTLFAWVHDLPAAVEAVAA